MKIVLKILGAVVVVVVFALLVLRVTGLDPHERIPGLWLTGNVAAATATDWSFTDKIVTVKVQTSTPYLLPHSVTTWCTAYNGQLYLATSGAEVREWPKNVARDPHVRLKVGDQLFDATLAVVTDSAEKEGVLQVRAKKYAQKYPPVGQTFTVYHVIPG